MVKELAGALHSGRYHKYSQVIAVGICGDNKIALPFWVVVQLPDTACCLPLSAFYLIWGCFFLLLIGVSKIFEELRGNVIP
jgi:hypothetical protein